MPDVYEELRARALAVTSEDLAPDGRDSPVLGVVMDLAYPEGTATVVGLADGTTSLYHSGGGGMIGGGGHAQVAEASRRWVATAEELVEGLEPANECPLPTGSGRVQLVALTPGGPRRAEAVDEELGSGSHPLSPLFLAGHDVITQLRLVDTAAPGDG